MARRRPILVAVRRNPDGESGVQAEGALVPRPVPPVSGQVGQCMFADALGTRAYAAPRRENDEGGRFTNRPSGDSHRAFHPSGCAAVSCGLAARPPFAGRAAPAVAVATPAPEGLVRHSGECVFTTRRSPLAFQGSLQRQRSVPEGGSAPLRSGGASVRRPAVRRSGGRPRCHSIRRTGLRGPTRPGGPFVLAYVDSNVSVSHPNNRARTNRDEEAVALGAGAGARPGRGAGEGWPDDARSGPRRRQRRRPPGTLRRHQGTDRRAGRSRTAWSRPAAVPIPRAPSTASEQSVRFGRERWFVRPALRAGVECDGGDVSPTAGGEPDVRTALWCASSSPRRSLRGHPDALPDGRVRFVPSPPRPPGGDCFGARAQPSAERGLDGLPARDCWTWSDPTGGSDGRAHPDRRRAVPGTRRVGSLRSSA